MSDYEVCSNGEDLLFLATCAIAGDFEPLTNGFVQPMYMSEDGRYVAEWILELQGKGSWPPTFEALKHNFSDLNWPSIPETRGLEPMTKAYDVLYSYQAAESIHMMRLTQYMAELEVHDAERTEILQQVTDKVRDLQQLGSEKRPIYRLGSDFGRMVNALMGKGQFGLFKDVSLPYPTLNETLRPFLPGVYVFYGRPKKGKSWTLFQIADWLARVVGIRVVLVDQENPEALLISRLCAVSGGADYETLRSAQWKVMMEGEEDIEPLTPEEDEALDKAMHGAEEISIHDNIVVMGKEYIDLDQGGIPFDTICEVADEAGARVLLIDQLQKISAPPYTRAGMSEPVRANWVLKRMEQEKERLIFATTQENREGDTEQTKFPTPKSNTVYGADAAAQACMALIHLHPFVLPDGSSVVMYTPTLMREGKQSMEGKHFVRVDHCSRFEPLSFRDGMLLAHQSVELFKKQEDDLKKEAKRRVNRGDADLQKSSRDIDEGGPATPASRYGRQRRRRKTQPYSDT